MNIGELLKTLAPTVASALGGPLAGAAVAAISSIFGTNATVDAVTKVLENGAMTPEQITAIKELELKYKNDEAERGFKYAELEYKKLELEVADRKNARDLQSATRSVTPEVLSWLIIGATLALEGYVLLNGVPPQVSEFVAGRILGTLDTAFATVLAYWLGTSFSSRGKDATIASNAAAAASTASNKGNS